VSSCKPLNSEWLRKPSSSLSKCECNAATLSRKPSARDVSSELKRADATLVAGVSSDDDMVLSMPRVSLLRLILMDRVGVAT